MIKGLLLSAVVLSNSCHALPTLDFLQNVPLKNEGMQLWHKITAYFDEAPPQEASLKETLNSIKIMLDKESSTLSQPVIDKVLTSLSCIEQYHVAHNSILTIIDYSLPSNQKRLWVFDLSDKKLLFHTYVSHGIKSGTLDTTFFSNKFNSRSSSLGVYRTREAYFGREGTSLRLDGLDTSFNDNAAGRAIVMHGGWYVEEPFIKKYGRAGRSWGCPALPLTQSSSIIQRIKDNNIMIVYYPSDRWFVTSKFLNCEKTHTASAQTTNVEDLSPPKDASVHRETVLFAPGGKRMDENPILVMQADKYAELFRTKPPLERMLRRQIDKNEYIALSTTELKQFANPNPPTADPSARDFSTLHFVIPVIKMKHGYYETEMHFTNYGKIKDIQIMDSSTQPNYRVYFEKRAAFLLKPTNQFIRWLGL